MTATDVIVNPTPEFDAPQLPVSASETPEERDARLASIVSAEQRAIGDVTTLVQPVPVHTDNPTGEIPFTSELWWYQGTDKVGEGPTPPATTPTITSLNPTTGPAAGGTAVTITGTGFTGATNVVFGAEPAASFTVDSATQVTATTAPFGGTPPATTDVTVMTPNGNAITGPDDWAWS